MTLLSLTGPDDVADADASVPLSQAVARIANGAGPEPLLKALIALDPAVATAWLRAQSSRQEDKAAAAQYLPLLVAAAVARPELWLDLAHVLGAVNGE